ncbi:MAG: glycine cleavage system protein GcvH [Chthoniobacteraceae bacterium]
MSNVPFDLKYATTHEWVRVEADGTARVGITDHAQAELTDIVFVELPALEAEVQAGHPIAVVESVKAASDIYSPISGTVIEANTALGDNPALVNTDSYGAGWLYRLKIANPAEMDALKSPADYLAQIG